MERPDSAETVYDDARKSLLVLGRDEGRASGVDPDEHEEEKDDGLIEDAQQ